MNTKKRLLGLLAAFVLPAAAWAQTDGRIVIHTPDQRDHLRKMTGELIKLAKTKDPNARMELFLKLGEERAKELEKMQEKGKSSHHDALGKSYDTLVTKGAAGVIENGAARGVDMTGALGRYAEATSKHLAVLQRVLANAPPAARKGLLTAIAASQHGHQQAMLAHQRGKGRAGGGPPGRQGGPGGVDQPGGGGKPAGVGKPGGEDGPGKSKGGPPPGKGPGVGEEGPGKGKGGPPPGKGNPNEEEGPGKGKGEGGPPPGKGKGKGGS